MKIKVTSRQLLNLLEAIVGDEFLEDLGMHVVGDGATPTEYEREAYKRMSKAYRVIHSLNKAHSCHSVHKVWRKEVLRLLNQQQAD